MGLKYFRIILFIVIIITIFDASARDHAPSMSAPNLGRSIDSAERARLSITIFSDGRGLPQGTGNAIAGRPIYIARCVVCHGTEGRGGPGGELAGGNPDLTLSSPDQTIGTYWPYATSLFDFVRRAMPLDAPWSLRDDEVYAVVAYLLHLNGIIAEDYELNAATLGAIKMPNHGGFVGIDAAISVP